MTVNEKIQKLAGETEGYTIETRRALHRLAELSGLEKKTCAFIEAEAGRLGLPSQRAGDTGLIVTLDTGRPGACVALRADIDALPLRENPENMKGPRACVADDPGACHACGHDAHTAMLLSAMRVLCAMKDDLCGSVCFCFESGEEMGDGWADILGELKKRTVNTAFALHVSSALEHGRLNIGDGARLAGYIPVDVLVRGRGGHGSRPDLSVNPVFCAASVFTNAAVAFVNQIGAGETVTLGITSIVGNVAANNIFADTARILGTMRYFNRAEGEKALEILKSVCTHTAAMNRCTAEFAPMMNILFEPTINDPQAAAKARAWIGELLPAGALAETGPWYATESFSKYLARYRGAFGFLGVRNEEKGCCAEHHNERFDVDESALRTGVEALVKYAQAAAADPEVAGWGYTQPDGPDVFVPRQPWLRKKAEF
ncbi:MAG: amidohydrolase [Oscillospiraceae bacterium]|nr:amidohydrolase [Oscillospiraceae bacterium]